MPRVNHARRSRAAPTHKTEIGRYAALGVSCEIVFRDGEQITVYGSIMGTLSPPPNDQTSDNGSSR